MLSILEHSADVLLTPQTLDQRPLARIPPRVLLESTARADVPRRSTRHPYEVKASRESQVPFIPTHLSGLQAMTSERAALMARHEADLGRMEDALQENNMLQSLLLEQASQVGALDAAQEALRQQLQVQKQLQGLHGRSLQTQVLQLQQQVEGGEEAVAKWAETHDALQVVHAKLQHERERVIELQNEKVGPSSHVLAEPITGMLLLAIVVWRKTIPFCCLWVWSFILGSPGAASPRVH